METPEILNSIQTFFCRLVGFLARCVVVVIGVVSGTFFAAAFVLLLIALAIALLAWMVYRA